jgi:hypothetical protein
MTVAAEERMNLLRRERDAYKAAAASLNNQLRQVGDEAARVVFGAIGGDTGPDDANDLDDARSDRALREATPTTPRAGPTAVVKRGSSHLRPIEEERADGAGDDNAREDAAHEARGGHDAGGGGDGSATDETTASHLGLAGAPARQASAAPPRPTLGSRRGSLAESVATAAAHQNQTASAAGHPRIPPLLSRISSLESTVAQLRQRLAQAEAGAVGGVVEGGFGGSVVSLPRLDLDTLDDLSPHTIAAVEVSALTSAVLEAVRIASKHLGASGVEAPIGAADDRDDDNSGDHDDDDPDNDNDNDTDNGGGGNVDDPGGARGGGPGVVRPRRRRAARVTRLQVAAAVIRSARALGIPDIELLDDVCAGVHPREFAVDDAPRGNADGENRSSTGGGSGSGSGAGPLGLIPLYRHLWARLMTHPERWRRAPEEAYGEFFRRGTLLGNDTAGGEDGGDAVDPTDAHPSHPDDQGQGSSPSRRGKVFGIGDAITNSRVAFIYTPRGANRRPLPPGSPRTPQPPHHAAKSRTPRPKTAPGGAGNAKASNAKPINAKTSNASSGNRARQTTATPAHSSPAATHTVRDNLARTPLPLRGVRIDSAPRLPRLTPAAAPADGDEFECRKIRFFCFFFFFFSLY